MKKLQKLLLTFALLLSVMLVGNTMTASAASKKVYLNRTNTTITVGNKTTLRVKNTSKKVTWTSSKKSVATVDKKGVVTAKKAGTTTITARVNGKKYTCKVTVQTPQQEVIARFTKAINDGNVTALVKCLNPSAQKEVKQMLELYKLLFDYMQFDFNIEGVANEVFASIIKTGANLQVSSNVYKYDTVNKNQCKVKVKFTVKYKYKGKVKSVTEREWITLDKVKGKWYINTDSMDDSMDAFDSIFGN